MSEPVIFFNIIRIPEGKESETLSAWTDISNWMEKSEGCISTRLHRSRMDPSRLINHAHFTTMESFRSLTENAEFRALSGVLTELGVEREAGVYDVVHSFSSSPGD